MGKKKKTEDKIEWGLIFLYVRAYVVVKWADFMTFLTKYEPFSLISDNNIFHYNNRKMHKIRDMIWEKYRVPALSSRDNYFYYIFYDKRRITLSNLQALLKDTDVFVSEHDNYIKVVIPRE